MEDMVKYILEGVLTMGVGAMIWILKDFKSSLGTLTENLTSITVSLKELIVKDESKDEKIGELKVKVANLEKDVSSLKLRIAIIEHERKPKP